TNDFMRF
uniref:FMRFamide-13 n=1 Tax=Sarcophaga bullata TaxID=7385 RepID=FAR13_SARBU|nr:RecName: Full=FMRFamide-13; AltName: Full=SabFMRFamide-13 [Sarcophaga bullata]